jgi:hypothetical protein
MIEIKDFKAEGVVETMYSYLITLQLRVASLEERCTQYENYLKELNKNVQANQGFVCVHNLPGLDNGIQETLRPR